MSELTLPIAIFPLLLERSVVVGDVVTSEIPLVLDRLVTEVALQLLALLVHVLDMLENYRKRLA